MKTQQQENVLQSVRPAGDPFRLCFCVGVAHRRFTNRPCISRFTGYHSVTFSTSIVPNSPFQSPLILRQESRAQISLLQHVLKRFVETTFYSDCYYSMPPSLFAFSTDAGPQSCSPRAIPLPFRPLRRSPPVPQRKPMVRRRTAIARVLAQTQKRRSSSSRALSKWTSTGRSPCMAWERVRSGTGRGPISSGSGR